MRIFVQELLFSLKAKYIGGLCVRSCNGGDCYAMTKRVSLHLSRIREQLSHVICLH